MKGHEEKAVALFLGGCNCAQSIFAAFSDVTGMEEKEALRLSSPFGGGMGRLREVCGAVSGMFMVLGCLYGYDLPDDAKKKELYARVQELSARFSAENGTIVCRELLAGIGKSRATSPEPEKRTPDYYSSRPCARFVGTAAAILDEYLSENGKLS